ncbi:protein naked cuticle homolog 2 [Prionailurus bengalensis]|uniref:protein naked cuticle homolog 2 n=1 Tax=Prionailurus bengalensis TaxID=37029 RepID=UPI001CA83379|nr:protein naked cuticle homolog 2 [Prionailurus bengalensis]
MHTICEAVDASVSHSSGSSRTLRVKLTVSPESSSKRKESPPPGQDREPTHCRTEGELSEDPRGADKRLSAHVRRPGADPHPCCARGPCRVDENTERRNHYLDLAGIENYTSKFGPGSPPAPAKQEHQGKAVHPQSRSHSQEADAHDAHHRRSQPLADHPLLAADPARALDAQPRLQGQDKQPLRSPKGSGRPPGAPGGGKPGRAFGSHLPAAPAPAPQDGQPPPSSRRSPTATSATGRGAGKGQGGPLAPQGGAGARGGAGPAAPAGGGGLCGARGPARRPPPPPFRVPTARTGPGMGSAEVAPMDLVGRASLAPASPRRAAHRGRVRTDTWDATGVSALKLLRVPRRHPPRVDKPSRYLLLFVIPDEAPVVLEGLCSDATRPVWAPCYVALPVIRSRGSPKGAAAGGWPRRTGRRQETRRRGGGRGGEARQGRGAAGGASGVSADTDVDGRPAPRAWWTQTRSGVAAGPASARSPSGKA